MYKKLLILCLVFSSVLYGGGRPSGDADDDSFLGIFLKFRETLPVLSIKRGIKRDEIAQSYEEIRKMKNWKRSFPGVPNEGPVAWYQVLNVPQTATPAEIQKACRTLSVQFHPDKNKDEHARLIFDTVRKASEATNEGPDTIHYTTPKLAQKDIQYPVEQTSLRSL